MIVFDAHVHLLDKELFKAAIIAAQRQDASSICSHVRPNEIRRYRSFALKKGIYKVCGIPWPITSLDVEAVNRHVIRQARWNPDLLIALPLIGPGQNTDWFEAELAWIGGLKDHFWITGRHSVETFFPIYNFLQDVDLPLVIHPSWREGVSRLRRIKQNFRGLKVVLAHSGRKQPFTGDGVLEIAAELRKFPEVYFETSTVRDSRVVRQLIATVGSDRVVFGSDYPLYKRENEDSFAEELRTVVAADLSEAHLKDVLCGTFRRLFQRAPWVRRMAPDDMHQLRRILAEISTDERRFLALKQKSAAIGRALRTGRNILVLEDGETIIGFVRVSDRSGQGALIEEIYIEPAYRGKGYGRTLLQVLQCRYAWLEAKVLFANIQAVTLVQKAGFVCSKTSQKARIALWKWVRKP